MTPEMVELEFAHIALDRKNKGGNAIQFEDNEYDAYEEEANALDSKLSDDGELPAYVPISQVASDKWVDIEDE